jgi:zinc/manganese transport system substrate-binding protein
MEQTMRIATFICIWVLAAAGSDAHGQLRIMTTLTDHADLARQIGGDRVIVRSVMQGPENIHNVFAKPTEMLFLNKADLFVHSGLDAEPWRDSLLKGGRNPRVMPGRPGNVDLSDGIELRDVPAGRIDRSMGDIHIHGNPHYMIDPRNVARMAATLARAMAAADAKNAEFYRENARKLVVEITGLHQELLGQLEPYRGLKVVTFHDGWGYFADAFGIEIVATIEPRPSVTPSAAEMRRVIQTMKREEVKIVIVETYNSREQARHVAEAAGAQLLVLPDHVHGMPGADSYQALFRHNIAKLIEAARAGGH